MAPIHTFAHFQASNALHIWMCQIWMIQKICNLDMYLTSQKHPN
jgi:hypothetical protein